MNKFMNGREYKTNHRWQLLATVSAIALFSSVYGAAAADSDRPPLWIELGSQLEGLSNAQEPFSPPFVPSLSGYGIFSPLRVQTPPHFGLSADGKITFAPDNGDWLFSASIRYGRSSRDKNQHQQTPNAKITGHIIFNGVYHRLHTKYPSSHVKFADAGSEQSERHLILDFEAGKDVGLGLFGSRGSSVLSVGVRIAQFSSESTTNMRVEPDVRYPTKPITSIPGFFAFEGYSAHFHDYAAGAHVKRNFQGLGPSLVWNASLPVAGNSGASELTFDWGMNAALLFGRQKAVGQHQTATQSFSKHGWYTGFNETSPNERGGHFVQTSILYHSNSVRVDRSKSVTVPNLGGSIGLSMRYSGAKISVGYRADFFFGAIDGGIDTRNSENRGFFGPYASISIGLGD